MSEHHDADFIEYVVKQLVENPDGVKVERTVDEMGVLIQLTVDRGDMGRVIGKEGRTAKALRTLLRVLGAKNNARVNLKIMEPDGGEVRIGADDDRGGSDASTESYTSPSADSAPEAEAEVAMSEPVAAADTEPETTPSTNDDQVTEIL